MRNEPMKKSIPHKDKQAGWEMHGWEILFHTKIRRGDEKCMDERFYPTQR